MDIGSIIDGKYLLTRAIGRGGMSTIFEASHVTIGTRVALKVMFSSKSAEDDDLKIARFGREAIAIGKVDTPYVVRVYDAGFDVPTRQPYIAMEILNGEDLSHLLKRNGPLHVPAALAIVAQACAGLHKAHEAGIVHRDIKPGNLFVSQADNGERVIKLLDFGIAKVRDLNDSISSELGTITETGTLVGSPYYMSPEQAKGLKTVDHRADVWSLGVVLFKCLTGRTPFDGHSTLGQVIVAVCGEDAPSVRSLAPWVPEPVVQIIQRALKRNVAHRFQSAYEMYEAIAPHLVHGGRILDGMLGPLPPDLQVHDRVPSTPGIPVEFNVTQVTPPASAPSAAFTSSLSTSLPVIAPPPQKKSRLALVLAIFALFSTSTFAGGLFVKLSSRAHPVTPRAASSASSASASSAIPPPAPGETASVAEAQPSLTTAGPVPASSSKATDQRPFGVSAAASGGPQVHTKPVATTTKPNARGSSGSGRLQGGVGGDVPF